MGAQVVLYSRGAFSIARRNLCRGQGGHIGEVRKRLLRLARTPAALALADSLWRHAQIGGVKSERPAIVLGELLEGSHRRARDPERDRAVQAVDAASRHAFGVVEIRGSRIEAFRRRSVAPAFGTVAGSAGTRIERLAAREIR